MAGWEGEAPRWNKSWLRIHPDGVHRSHHSARNHSDRVGRISQMGTYSGCSQMSGYNGRTLDDRGSHAYRDNLHECRGSRVKSCRSLEGSAGWSGPFVPCTLLHSCLLHSLRRNQTSGTNDPVGVQEDQECTQHDGPRARKEG